MFNFLSNFRVDEWFKLLILLGAILIIISLFITPMVFTSFELFILGSALFTIGLGEWRNHVWSSFQTPQTLFYPSSVARSRKRFNTKIGTLLDIIGVTLFIYFAYRVYPMFID